MSGSNPLGAEVSESELSAAAAAKLNSTSGNQFLALHDPVVVQGTWVIAMNALQMYGGAFNRNTSAAQNDEVTYQCYLSAGTYSLVCLGIVDANYGRMHCYVGGADKGYVEWYAAAQAFNVTSKLTGITIATAGLYTIALKLESKHASSTGYNSYLTEAKFVRTA